MELPASPSENGIDPQAAGALRASLGLVSNFTDAWRLVEFLRGFVDWREEQR